MTPSRLMRPSVGRSPVTPQRDEGPRIDPLVSVPIAKPTRPAAVAEPGPADDPPDPCEGSHGLFVCPPNHRSPCAISPVVSFATSTAPGVAQHLDDARVLVDDLILERARAPRRLVALDGDDVLRPPRDAVQRPFVFAGGDLGIGLLRLCQAEVVEDGDGAVQRRVEAMAGDRDTAWSAPSR